MLYSDSKQQFELYDIIAPFSQLIDYPCLYLPIVHNIQGVDDEDVDEEQ